MRLIATADLHYNHTRSSAGADELIVQMNQAGGDVLLVIGDAAVADGDALERCLSRFRFSGPKLFVAGNHELWTTGPDSYQIHSEILPRRIRELGWQWLQADPFITNDLAIVGSVGWYDYSFAEASLGIPRRFYERKISPGAAAQFDEFAPLFDTSDDISAHARDVIARWNDGKFVKLHRTDEQFLAGLLAHLEEQLRSLATHPKLIAAVHHVPFRQLLPPCRGGQWDFARAYLGSEKLGQLLQQFENITHVLCGHSHWPVETVIGPLRAINIGSGYRRKLFRTIDF